MSDRDIGDEIIKSLIEAIRHCESGSIPDRYEYGTKKHEVASLVFGMGADPSSIQEEDKKVLESILEDLRR